MTTGNKDGTSVLLCGHRSFAAQGLAERLRQAGHEVVCFSRGIQGEEEGVVTGSPQRVHANPHLSGRYDTVINYILLKDESVQSNIEYIESLLRLCRERSVSHLIHISSISVYKMSIGLVHEQAEVETNPGKKGPYGELKVATEQEIVKDLPLGTKLTLVRPGFILGSGLFNPIVGTGVRLPWNRLLALGNSRSQMPLITRDLVNEAIARIVAQPPADDCEVLLLVVNNPPTKKEYLDACCRILGCGTSVSALPVMVWLMAGFISEGLVRVIGRSHLKPLMKVRGVCRNYRFDSTHTQTRLGMNWSFDWRSALRQSLDGQESNFVTPNLQPKLPKTEAKTITFLGFGRVAKQKHLVALKHLGFDGTVNAYDLKATVTESGQQVQPITNAQLASADLFVVASPGRAHTDALPLLEKVEGPVLVEKPLCYTSAELREWQTFAESRKSQVLVCHNYRFKRNVVTMISFLQRFNSGRLNHVTVHFDSPPVNAAAAVWSRNERYSRTLLMDYSLHFLDVACMFAKGEWQSCEARYKLNSLGQTSLIEGRLASLDYSVSFLLRQSFRPRRTRLLFNFQNYSISLGFFPDTFVVYMSDDNPWLHFQEALVSARAVSRKIFAKMTGKDSDLSHAMVFAAVTNKELNLGSWLTVASLAPFYRMMFQISEMVYKE